MVDRWTTRFKRRDFIRLIGGGLISAQSGIINSAMAQMLVGVRSSFSTAFTLASSPLINSPDFPGIRLRWNFPLFDQNGTIASCLPDTITIYRVVKKIDPAILFLPPDPPDVGLTPVGLFPHYMWKTLSVVPLALNPALSGIVDAEKKPAIAAALTFTYLGPDATVKLISPSGDCCLVANLRDKESFYFDGEIAQFEVDTQGAGSFRLEKLFALSIDDRGELNVTTVLAEVKVRAPIKDKFSVDQSARRMHQLAGTGVPTTTLPHGQVFLDANDWLEFLSMGDEIAQDACAGNSPATIETPGGPVAKLDLFLMGLLSRWEMSCRAGFGIRDGQYPTGSKYDKFSGQYQSTDLSQDVAYYRAVATYDGSGKSIASNVASTRLDRYFPLSKPDRFNYLIQQHGSEVGDFISVLLRESNDSTKGDETTGEITAETVSSWAHNRDDRAAGAYVVEEYRPSNSAAQTLADWLQNSGVYGHSGFAGRVRRTVPADFATTVQAKAYTFDAWDQLSADALSIGPKVVLNYTPASPALACASFVSPPMPKLKLVRRVDSPDLTTICFAPPPAEPASTYVEWSPDALLKELARVGFATRLQILESTRRPQVWMTSIATYAMDTHGAFVTVADATDFNVFVGGYLDAQNGRYALRNVIGNRLYIGRFRNPAGSGFVAEGTCTTAGNISNIEVMDEPTLGACKLSENYDDEAFWKEIGSLPDLVSGTVAPSFTFDSLREWPELPDSVDYRCRIIAEQGAQKITGEYSNIVSALRTPLQPSPPRDFLVRQLGYDFYDRLLIAIDLAADEPEGTFGIAVAPGVVTSDDFGRVCERSSLIGSQYASQGDSLFEALNIGKNYQTDRIFTVGLSRLNKANTEGPAKTLTIKVPVE